MSDYSNTLDALRKAREQRDQSRDELYKLLVRQLKLLRAQKRFDRGEVPAAPQIQDAITEMRKSLDKIDAQIDKIEAQLRSWQQMARNLREEQDLLNALLEQSRTLQAAVERINGALDQPNLSKEERARLAANREELLKRAALLEKRIQAVQEKIGGLQKDLGGREQQRAPLQHELERLQRERQRRQEELDRTAKTAPASRDGSDDLGRLKEQIAQKRGELAGREKIVGGIIAGLYRDMPPQRLIERWNDQTPIMLLPLRLETRFKEVDGQQELWVRVYPDDVAVTTHEKVLTDSEYQAGKDYWTALRGAAGEDERKNAWRKLADRFGPNRAAWVALQTKPLNWNSDPPPAVPDLQFPQPELTKPDSWTQAPHSRVMPDRFVLMAYKSGKLVHTLVGTQITDILVLGPAPLEEDGNPDISRDPADNRLRYGDDFVWLADFPTALSSGMAFRLPLNADEAVNGFDQLLVLGLKLSADESDAQKLVEDLIDNHHYSTKGFSLIRQGTATNNTSGDDATYSSSDWMHDDSYFVETGEPLFTWNSDPNQASDGQRLADYLGIHYEPLQYVSNSDAADHAEAVAMNRALYAGTLGYYLNNMLNEVMSDAAAEQMRAFFTEFVTGRGPIPAIRVGSQPYGLLPTSSLARWAYPELPPVGVFPPSAFDEKVRQVLVHLFEQWQTLQPQLRQIGSGGSANANLMQVLGLQPTSADYYQRIGYSYDYLRNLEQFAWGGKYGEDVLLMLFEQMSGRQFLRAFGYREQRDDGTPKPVPLLLQLIYQHYHTRLDNRNLIDGLPLSEDREIQPYDTAAGKNYIDWLIDNAGDVDNLEQQNFGTGIPRPNALLYLMLHNGLLLEAKNSIHRLLSSNEIVANELVRSRKFMNISSQPDVSPWEVFRAPANRVIPNEVSTQPLLAFVQLDRFRRGAEVEIGRHLGEVKDALLALADLPTARLERLLAEHIDTLNYRLDSWQTALFDRRLSQQRGLSASSRERRMGVYLGGFGYLENVLPAASKAVKLSEQRSLPEELREGKDNLYYRPGNGGYVHTPSINHATAAAILRSGYLTHAAPTESDTLAVNLSSERVRRAKYLIDGVRNGQTLEALLGYQFERGLHDWTTRTDDPVILDQLKPIFRKAFPIKKTRLPRQGQPNEPAEVVDDFTVVNGLDLARVTAPFPYGITGMPPLSTKAVDAIEQEKNNIENTLDALGDLLTAESAYQLALGNFDRAAAVMQSISGGQLPVEIEVINSSRGTDHSFTNHVVIHFDPTLSANPWPTLQMTRRARTEPGLNHWLGELLGDPAEIQCIVHAVDTDGVTLQDAGGNPIEDWVSLADLNVQPLDFIAMIGSQIEAAGYSELEARVRYAFARKKSVSDATIVKIEFAKSSGPGMRSFAEILAFANAIREMLGNARSLRAQDFVVSSKTVTTQSDNPGNVDVVELQNRIESLRSDFDALFNALSAAADDAANLPSPATLEILRKRLVAVADAGMVYGFPLSAVGAGDDERESLLAQSQSLTGRYEALKKSYDTSLTSVNAADTKPPQKVSLLTDMAKLFFGDAFVLMPKFTLTDPADVSQADTNRSQLLDYVTNTKQVPLPVDEWLLGISHVRPNMHLFGMVLMLSQTFNHDTPPCSPLQLPFKAQDSWLAVAFPPDTTIVHDTLAILQCLPQGFQPTGLQAGLLVDEWTETIPLKEEVTGITFNYDQPNSTPPQVILLAVTPVVSGHWQWDHLVGSVLETIQRAKLRAVEPDMIENLAGFATLLPSTISEFSTGKSSISLDYSLNLAYIYEQVAQLSGTAIGG